MDLLNYLGLLSFVLTIAALQLLGKPSRRTFPVFIISVLVQSYIFIQTGVLLGYNIVNWVRWKKAGVG